MLANIVDIKFELVKQFQQLLVGYLVGLPDLPYPQLKVDVVEETAPI